VPPAGSTSAPIPLKNGFFREQAQSGHLERDRMYLYRLYTHCGLDRSHVDLDGSYWNPEDESSDPNPPAGLGNPTDQGTVVITSTDPDRLVFTSQKGVVVAFQRAGQSLDFAPCA
jgi:hypothetical protein